MVEIVKDFSPPIRPTFPTNERGENEIEDGNDEGNFPDNENTNDDPSLIVPIVEDSRRKKAITEKPTKVLKIIEEPLKIDKNHYF